MLQFVQTALSNTIFAGLSLPKKIKEARKEKKDTKSFWTVMLTNDVAFQFASPVIGLKISCLIFDQSKFETTANCRLLAYVFFVLGTVFRHFLDIYTYQDFE